MELHGNIFALALSQDTKIEQYVVSVTRIRNDEAGGDNPTEERDLCSKPDISRMRNNRQIIAKCLEVRGPDLVAVYLGHEQLYSPKRFKDVETLLQLEDIENGLLTKDYTDYLAMNSRTVKISILHVNTLYVTPDTIVTREVTQALEDVCKNYIVSQSDYIYMPRVIVRGTPTKTLPWCCQHLGVHAAVKLLGGENGHPMPAIEIDAKEILMLRDEQPLDNLLCAAFGDRNWLDPRSIETANEFLAGTKVFCRHRGEWQTRPRTVKAILVEDDNVVALLEMARGMECKKPVSDCRVRPHSRVTCDQLRMKNAVLPPPTPEVRYGRMEQIYKFMGFPKNDYLDAFSINIVNRPTPVREQVADEEKRSAPALKEIKILPQVLLKPPVRVNPEKRSFSLPNKFLRGGAISDVCIVVCDTPEKNVADIERAAKVLLNQADGRGVKKIGSGWSTFQLQSDKHVYSRLENIADSLKAAPRPLLLLVSPSNKNRALLKLLEQQKDLATLQIHNETLQKAAALSGGRQTMDNLLLKVNLKSGGVTYDADSAGVSWCDEKTLVLGVDVSHPPAGSNRFVGGKPMIPSVFGMSVNARSAHEFIANFEFVEPRLEEVSEDSMKRMASWALHLWMDARGNKEMPERVLYFRDGVADEQESHVQKEMEAIRAVGESMMKERSLGSCWTPKSLVLIVRKRHMRRFFKMEAKPKNPIAGTTIGGMSTAFGKIQFYISPGTTNIGSTKTSLVTLVPSEVKWDVHDWNTLATMVQAASTNHQLVGAPTSIPTAIYVAHEISKRGNNLLRSYRWQHKTDADWRQMSQVLSYNNSVRTRYVRLV